MKTRNIILTAATLAVVTAVFISASPSYKTVAATNRRSLSTSWTTDILGEGYESRVIDMGDTYDGPVCSTLIRHLSPCGDSTHRAILYIHGFNDYFFQRPMADRMADSCYNFYAVDLRRYGRSILPHQLPFNLRDDREYFVDIDSALAVMRNDGITDVTLMGHSTGGLTTSLYMALQPDTIVKRLILNSPFLDWRLSPSLERYGVPVISALGRVIKSINIKQRGEGKYAHSLLRDYDGEWEYDTIWKKPTTTHVTSAWVSAINRAQHELRRHKINVPILLLHSDASSSGKNARMFDTDIVLDVDDIHRYGTELGPNVTEASIPGGLHDLILSREEARDSTYRAIFRFLSTSK